MYEEAMRTPLLISYPQEIKQKMQTEKLAQNLDIAPTLLEVAGIQIPEDMQGESLRRIWRQDDADWRDAIYYHYYEKGFGATPHYGVRTERYKLIRFYDVVDSWEFYDLETDPTEMTNLYSDPAYAHTIKELKNKMAELQTKYMDVYP
jgi:arylsulfatase A-like enzyme